MQDVRFGLKMLKSNPGFTALAVLTLALGIAVNATVFSWIYAVLLHPLPGAHDVQCLALIESTSPDGANSYLDYRDYRDNLTQVAAVAIARFTPLNLSDGGRPERAWAQLVSANYFDVLEVKPALGRTFLPEEGRESEGGYPVAVISYRMWQTRFHADPKALGSAIRLNRHELTIIGVAPPEFHGSLVGLALDLWMPVTMATAMGTGDGTLHYRATRDIASTIVRLKPGVSIEQAGAEVEALSRQLEAEYPQTNRGVTARVTPIWKGRTGAQGLLMEPLRILMAVCAMLLLVVCANVANLLLARAVSRQREFGVRLALGARRSRLARQLLTETLLLAVSGASIGVLLVMWMGQSLSALMPAMGIPWDFGGGLNVPTLGFTVGIVVVATLVSGTAPALLSARADLSETLNEGGRAGGAGTNSHRLRGLLVTGEVAMAMVALIGAGLFFRSFQNASSVQPGFDMANMSTSQFYLSNAGYSGHEQHLFCRKLRERMEAQPGVLGMTYSDVVPLGNPGHGMPYHQLEVDGYIPRRDEQMIFERATVPPGYFKLMGIPLLEGRDFTGMDGEDTPMVIVVNETFARRFFGGRNPIGRKVRVEHHPATVIGLVKDSKYGALTETQMPFFYIPFDQWFEPGLNFAVMLKTSGDPMLLTNVLQREALALNPDAVFHTSRMEDATEASLYPQRVAATLLSVVGAACLLLAAIGLYCVMSYAVSQRTQELGVRLALGASRSDVLALVVREGLRLTMPGLAAGIVAALGAARLVSGMLFHVSAADPATFAAAAMFLGLVAVIASYLPAVRATRLDPMRAIRRQ
jgi:predicted permease